MVLYISSAKNVMIPFIGLRTQENDIKPVVSVSLNLTQKPWMK